MSIKSFRTFCEELSGEDDPNAIPVPPDFFNKKRENKSTKTHKEKKRLPMPQMRRPAPERGDNEGSGG